MNFGGSFSFKVSRSGVEVMFLVFYPGFFLHNREDIFFLQFVAKIVNIRDALIVYVD